MIILAVYTNIHASAWGFDGFVEFGKRRVSGNAERLLILEGKAFIYMTLLLNFYLIHILQ